MACLLNWRPCDALDQGRCKFTTCCCGYDSLDVFNLDRHDREFGQGFQVNKVEFQNDIEHYTNIPFLYMNRETIKGIESNRKVKENP